MTPAGWAGGRLSLRFRLSVAFLAVVTACLAAGAGWAFLTGDPVGGVLLAAGAVYIGHLVGFSVSAWWDRGRPSGNATLVPEGTTMGVRFGYAAWPYYWLAAVLVMTLLVVLVVTVGAAMSGTVIGVATAVGTAALAVAVGAFLVTMLRLAPGAITVSPTGVSHRGLTHRHDVPWYAISSVEARWLGTPVIAVVAQPSPGTRVRRQLGRFGPAELGSLPDLVVRTYWMATDPDTVLRTLTFYQTQPELRAELATPAALDRIAGGGADRE